MLFKQKIQDCFLGMCVCGCALAVYDFGYRISKIIRYTPVVTPVSAPHNLKN